MWPLSPLSSGFVMSHISPEYLPDIIVTPVYEVVETVDKVDHLGQVESLRLNIWLVYSTVQYSTVQYSTVQYSTVQYSTVVSTLHYSTVQYSSQYITL